MMKSKKLALMAALMVLGAALTGCAQQPQETFATVAPTQEPVAQVTAEPAGAVVDEETAAVVNGYAIRMAEVKEIENNLAAAFSYYGYDASSGEALTVLRQASLRYAIQMALLDQKAEEWHITGPEGDELAQLTAAQKAEWDSIVSYYMTSVGGITDASTEEERAAARAEAIASLAELGYTEESQVAGAIRDARRELVEAEMVKDVNVTDAEIEADYANRVQTAQASYAANALDYIYTYERDTVYGGKPAYYVPEGYRGVLQILLPVDETLMKTYQTLSAQREEQIETAVEAAENGEKAEETTSAVSQEQVDDARDAILASVQATCDEIRTKLAEGADILALIDQYNTDPGMQNENNRALGYSVHMDSVAYDPAFIAAAFSVDQIGALSQPEVGSYGVYLVYYLRDVPAGPAELTAQLRSQLMENLLSEKENQVLTETMNRWIEEAQIETTETGSRYVSGN